VLALALVADWVSVAADRPDGQPDLVEYHAYALGFWAHHLLPHEYPPLSIAAFLLSLAPPVGDFPVVFGAWMLLFVGATYVLLARAFGAERGVAFLTYVVAGAAATVFQRFDIVAALVVLAAYLALRRQNFEWCYGLLAVGTLLKVFPLFLLPLVAIDHFRSVETNGKRGAAARVAGGLGLFSGVVLAGFGFAAIADPSHALAVFGYATSRPLEVESGPATLLWLGSLAGWPVQGSFSFLSFNLVGSADRFLEPAAAAALVGGWAFVCARRWTGRISAGHAWIACLCVLLLTNRVLSAQYLLWVVPLVAAVDGLSAIWLVIALLTALVFPVLFILDVVAGGGTSLDYGPAVLVAIAARNALLLVAAVRAGASDAVSQLGQI
jgi:hypothetical protein